VKKALIIVDLLNDFIEEKGALYCGKRAKATVPYIRSLIDQYRRENGVVIYVCDSHSRDDREFGRFPPHCVGGTWGAEIVKDLKPAWGDIVIKKTRYSAFFKTELEAVLKTQSVDEVGVVGVCTSICVMDTVGGLANRDYGIKVYKRGVADVDRKMERCALERMRRVYGVEIVAS
jgi:nicotinamidase/pyrazinamidase